MNFLTCREFMKTYFGFDFIGVESSGGTIYYKVKGN